MDPGKALRALTRTSAAAVSVAILVTTASQTARADDAAQILKAMTDYTGAQKSISAAFDSDIEVITPELQKIQFTSSGQMSLNRPDRLRIRRTGGYADVELTYDGKTLSLYGNNAKSYVQADAAGTIDQLIDTLQAKTGAAMPGTDLLLRNSYDELMATVIDAKHIGQGVVDGVECEHLAFRGIDTDWQIRIEAGARPIPRKYIITSKTLVGAPQYTLRIKDWKTDAIADADTFVFKPPTGATKASLDSSVMVEIRRTSTRHTCRSQTMTISSRKAILLIATAAGFAGGLLWSGNGTIDGGFVSGAEARVGRPLTPMSYAGVARRTTRRAVVGGAVVGGAVAAGAYAAPACAQVVDAYGRIYTQC